MLRVTSLGRSLGACRAIGEGSREFNEGELVTLLGPSGCGKSTTLRCIAGLETPTGGEIRIGDEIVAAPDRGVEVPPEDRRIGMVFQSYALWPNISALEHVIYALRRQRLSSEERRVGEECDMRCSNGGAPVR